MDIENLVFSGSGTLLAGYSGATKELFKHIPKTNIKRICATSGGSIYSYLLILHKMDTSKVEDIIMEMDFNKFFDNSFGWFRDIWRLITQGGWNKGIEVLDFLQDQMEKVTGRRDMTFLEFFGKFGIDLTVVVTDLSRGHAVYCNSRNTPNWSVTEMIRCSMSIPIIFVPWKRKKITYVDGGLKDNFAITIYDYMGSPEQTIGFKFVDDNGSIVEKEVNGLIEEIQAIRKCMISSQYRIDTTGIDRTLKISDCQLDGTNPLDDDQKRLLIEAGQNEVKRWIKKL